MYLIKIKKKESPILKRQKVGPTEPDQTNDYDIYKYGKNNFK